MRAYTVKSIQVAEAAKVIENIHAINIAQSTNSPLFEKISLDTTDVLDAASSKWNFQKYTGTGRRTLHRVDPFYLTHKASKLVTIQK